jgi:GDP/UDP-N,N'-diacetylbacillosamine 2-epimerase (hydrolysing)
MLALVGSHMNIPVVHVQGGDISGNIDGMVRYAITSLSHLHLVSNPDSAARLVRIGENEWRVVTVGSPHLDGILESAAPKDEVCSYLGIDGDAETLLVMQHPVTEQWSEAEMQIKETIDAVKRTGLQSVVIYPNNDAGSAYIQEGIMRCEYADMRLVRNLPRNIYLGLMQMSSVMIGNSSSGLIEAPSFKLPVVNIGRRQDGRLKAKNVIDTDYDSEDIYTAINTARSDKFKRNLDGLVNPYGDGHSSDRVIKALEEMVIDERLLFKQREY